MPKTKAGTVRNRIFINDEWLFSHSFSDEMCRKDYDEKDMGGVRLPHTNREPASQIQRYMTLVKFVVKVA